jgi:hypothetical protein
MLEPIPMYTDMLTSVMEDVFLTSPSSTKNPKKLKVLFSAVTKN